MSELKRRHINEVMDMFCLTRGDMNWSQVYYADDADKVIEEKDNEIRRLKRALYKACANWAHHRVFVRLNTNEKAWDKVERKCRAMAEKFK